MYLSPEGKVLQGKSKVKEYLMKNNLYTSHIDKFSLMAAEVKKTKTHENSKGLENTACRYNQGGWKECDFKSLKSWKFRLAIEDRRYEYMSPDGKVFISRGSVLRFLIKQGRTSYSELMQLKTLMKNNYNQHHLKKNDRFIRTLPADLNFLIFIRTRSSC